MACHGIGEYTLNQRTDLRKSDVRQNEAFSSRRQDPRPDGQPDASRLVDRRHIRHSFGGGGGGRGDVEVVVIVMVVVQSVCVWPGPNIDGAY